MEAMLHLCKLFVWLSGGSPFPLCSLAYIETPGKGLFLCV